MELKIVYQAILVIEELQQHKGQMIVVIVDHIKYHGEHSYITLADQWDHVHRVMVDMITVAVNFVSQVMVRCFVNPVLVPNILTLMLAVQKRKEEVKNSWTVIGDDSTETQILIVHVQEIMRTIIPMEI